MPPRRGRGPGPPLPYDIIAGATPFSHGWLLLSAKIGGSTLSVEQPRVVASFRSILDERPSYSIVALNAPTGLRDIEVPGGRTCERDARMLLGARRGQAVRPAPSRRQLAAASAGQPARSDAVSSQLLELYLDLQGEMAPYLQRTVFEARPELSFYQMNGEQPLLHPKRRAAGREERRQLLSATGAGIDRVLENNAGSRAEVHLLDAAACLWTARRIAGHAALRLPATPEWDSLGLRMEILR